jgi:hypothetical protein
MCIVSVISNNKLCQYFLFVGYISVAYC